MKTIDYSQVPTHERKRVREVAEKLKDPLWRLENLYYLRDEQGQKVKFKLRPAQRELYDNLWYKNIVPKARQLGMTTFFCILFLDQVLFNADKSAGIIAHKKEDMKRIFRDKIKYAWEQLPDWIRRSIGDPSTDTANELVFPNGSNIFVTMSTRGGTVQYLHISEFGYICAKTPHKAEEIVTGALNSAHEGSIVSIESTAHGKEGFFYDFCMDAKKKEDMKKELSPMDYKLFFFPWYVDEKYTLDPRYVTLTQQDKEYFTRLQAKENITLTEGQKAWYVNRRGTLGDKMFQEFPTTLEEAFSASVEGSYYGNLMSRAMLENRVSLMPIDPMVPVDTYWDLGINDYTVILFVQSVGPQIRFVDVYYNHGEGLEHYVHQLHKKGYRYRNHYFPHDIEVREFSGQSRKQMLFDLGLRSVIVGPKLGISDGIAKVRSLFSRFYFDEERADPLVSALVNYRQEWDAKLGMYKDRPRHDENSHFADAVRLLGVTWRETLYGSGPSEEQGLHEESFFV